MSSIARKWDFLYHPTLGGSKGVLLSHNKQVAFPTHYWMKEAFASIGEPTAFFDYRASRLGRSTHSGKENAHIESAVHQYAILSAESVARGWLYNPVGWEETFTTERTRTDNLFLRVEYTFERGMLELVNAATLWDCSTSLPYECEDALRFTFFQKRPQDNYADWVKLAIRAKLTPEIVLEAAKNTVIEQNVDKVLSPIARMIISAENTASIQLSRIDFTSWMFIFAGVIEPLDEEDLALQAFIDEVIGLHPDPTDFQKLRASGIPLKTIPYALGSHIDPHLFSAL